MPSRILKLSAVSFRLFILLAILAPVSAWAEIDLEAYEEWQAYNGWPIRVIEFPGIASFSRAELLTVMATEKPTWLRRYMRIGSRTVFYADNFASDIIRLERFYSREGFPHARVRGFIYPHENKQELRVKVEISEGLPLILEAWGLHYVTGRTGGLDSAKWSRLMPIAVGKRLAQSEIRISADTLRFKLRQNGYARAAVGYSIVRDSVNNLARLMFHVDPKGHCWFGKTHFRGLKQVSEGTARREMTYREYEPFSPDELEETRKQLVRLETFNFVRLRPDTTAPGDTLTIWVRIEEGNRYTVRLGGGYSTEERAGVSGEFRDLNFFGRGRRFTFKGNLAEIIRQAEARLFWPHTPYNATDLTLIPKWKLEFEPGYKAETKSFTTILSASPLRKFNLSVSNEAGEVIRTDYAEEGPDVKTTYTKSVETISAAWDTRDNPLIPRQGHLLGLTAAESGAFYRTDFRWWRLILQGRIIIPVIKFTSVAAKTEFGVMGPLHDSDITPREERFYLGGVSTVRGWQRNRLSPRASDEDNTPVGGDAAFHVTGEIRREVWGPVALILFMDAGNVWADYDAADFTDLLPSAGIGLRFLTPVGPIRTDVGYQLRKNPYADDEPRWGFHFSLGTPF